MSDEYASSGFKGSLANESAGDYVPRPTDSGMNNTSAGGGEGTGRDYTSNHHDTTNQDSDYKTGNYPPEGDSTSSGGYDSTINSFASKPPHSRGGPSSTFSSSHTSSSNASNSNSSSNPSNSSSGLDANLITQSTNGTSLVNELDDAKQGVDGRSRDSYAHEQHTHTGSGGVNARSRGQGATVTAGEGELNPYAGSSMEGREEAGERLAGAGQKTQGGQ